MTPAVPVIVGVGQVNDRPDDPAAGRDSQGLMEAALRAADRDAGGGWLAGLDSLAVVNQISFPQLGDVSPGLAQAVGARGARCGITDTAHGDYPIKLLNEAANGVASGEVRIAAVVGGEALRTAARRAGGGNAIRDLAGSEAPSLRQRYGLVAPTDVYPLYENAARAAYGQSLAEAQAETGEIWAQFSAVAAANEGAWLRAPVSAGRICTPDADNRRLAHPYLKLMVANSSVNQGAGFIVTSLDLALQRGVPPERIIYIGAGAAAHEDDDFFARDRYDQSPGMIASLTQTLARNRLTADELDFVELYSCFPCIPKMARRAIGWPLTRPASVFGGLTFGGGPIGNYMSHAVVSMVQQLRQRGKYGLLYANGGFASHNHAIVLSSLPMEQDGAQDFNVQAAADAARGTIPPLLDAYHGPGTIETYTVFFARDGNPQSGVIVARTPDGERFLARVDQQDEACIAFLTDGVAEPVGTAGQAVIGADRVTLWVRP